MDLLKEKYCLNCNNIFKKKTCYSYKMFETFKFCSRNCSFDYQYNNRTHCKNGHEYSLENTKIHENGYRNCKICIEISHSTIKSKLRKKEMERIRDRNMSSEERKDKNLRKRYNSSLEEYNKMFFEQKGCCKICNIHQSDLSKPLFIDRCHEQNVVRGLLCQHCNSLLGFSKDNIQTLQKAIEYLKEFEYQKSISFSNN